LAFLPAFHQPVSIRGPDKFILIRAANLMSPSLDDHSPLPHYNHGMMVFFLGEGSEFVCEPQASTKFLS
jgi:hypothetical protein